MKLNKKTIAVSTASLVIMGGTAFAYYAASGTGTAQGQVSTDNGKLTLGVDKSDWGHITDDGGYTIKVIAANNSTRHAFRVTTLTPDSAFGGGSTTCPATAFTASAPTVTPNGTAPGPVDVQMGTKLADGFQVGTVKVTMNPVQDAKACEGVNLTLSLASS